MRRYLKIGAVLGLYAAAALLFFLAAGYAGGGLATVMLFKLAAGGLGTAALSGGSILLAGCLPEKKRQIGRVTVWILFGLYVCILLFLLFGDAFYGRTNWAAGHSLADAWLYSTNWIPFATISNYCRWLLWDLAPQAVVNLGGNLAAFAPMGVFLPLLFRRMDRFGWYCLLIGAVILLVEFTQLLIGVGVCDVDDFILNFTGAAAFFGLSHLPPVKRLFVRLGLRPCADL